MLTKLISYLHPKKSSPVEQTPLVVESQAFSISKDHNPNYLASIVKIQNLRKHENAHSLQCVSLYGCNVITDMKAQENDLYVYFPLECSISKEFISYTNGFEDKESNRDKEVKGFFNKHGRVRAIRLRGVKSEGFIIPVEQLELFCKNVLKKEIKITEDYVNETFDEVFGHNICKKYIPANLLYKSSSQPHTKGNTKKWESKLIEKQFNFHPDTLQLKREIRNLQPNDTIAITNKIHGCNVVVSNVLVKMKLSWWEKFLKTGFKINIQDKEYGMLYSSRSVIKNLSLDGQKDHNHFYGVDVWGMIAEKAYPLLKNGITIYGEIYGYLPNGAMIQHDYDYGCNLGQLDYVVFRMTYTNTNGDVFELSHPQVQEYCKLHGLKMPETYYYGTAKNLFPEIPVDENWSNTYLQKLIDTYLEKDCHLCKSKPNTPAEGIMLRIDKPLSWEIYKLKSFRFLEKESKELDKEQEPVLIDA